MRWILYAYEASLDLSSYILQMFLSTLLPICHRYHIHTCSIYQYIALLFKAVVCAFGGFAKLLVVCKVCPSWRDTEREPCMTYMRQSPRRRVRVIAQSKGRSCKTHRAGKTTQGGSEREST